MCLALGYVYPYTSSHCRYHTGCDCGYFSVSRLGHFEGVVPLMKCVALYLLSVSCCSYPHLQQCLHSFPRLWLASSEYSVNAEEWVTVLLGSSSEELYNLRKINPKTINY